MFDISVGRVVVLKVKVKGAERVFLMIHYLTLDVSRSGAAGVLRMLVNADTD